jgi:hypothetical protein
MRHVMGLTANNLNIKIGILHTQTFWQLTHQSLPRLWTPHDGVQVWAAALYEVPKDSVHGPTILRLS